LEEEEGEKEKEKEIPTLPRETEPSKPLRIHDTSLAQGYSKLILPVYLCRAGNEQRRTANDTPMISSWDLRRRCETVGIR